MAQVNCESRRDELILCVCALFVFDFVASFTAGEPITIDSDVCIWGDHSASAPVAGRATNEYSRWRRDAFVVPCVVVEPRFAYHPASTIPVSTFAHWL